MSTGAKRGDAAGSSGQEPRGRKWVWWMSGGALLLLAGCGVGWAVASVLTPAEDPLSASSFTHVAVSKGEVGSSISLNTVAAWTPVPVGANRAAGVVTGVAIAAGDEVSQGSTLYLVDQRPIVVAQGTVPAYRAISDGAEGADVAQIQEMLLATSHYKGVADGKDGAGTGAAIRSWQKASGVLPTGIVEIGDVIFVPQLPTRVALDSKVIDRGLLVSGGEQVVRALPSAPDFTVPVTDSQSKMMPAGVRVEITSPDHALWEGVVAGVVQQQDQSGTVTVQLKAADGGVICRDACARVPVTGEALLSSRIVTVEPVAGLVVPSAALVTSADGQVAVIDADGTQVRVKVVTSARGMSVIEGAELGLRVRVPGNGRNSG